MVLPVTVRQSLVQIAAVEQCAHDLRHAADVVDVLGDVFAAGLQVGDVGRALEDLGDTSNRSNSMPHSCAMAGRCSAAVGRAAGRRHDGRRVLEGLAGADVARTDAVGEQPHHGLAARQRIGVAALVGRGRAGRGGQRQADRLGHAWPWCWR